ncbi:hypothetical protein AWH48_09225 [Domibacillus aminovorans]|uniref:histidine kinase n=1 Tax=Domibacillus aminovorans TaxID=29332 RepID=A0A177KN06_9BACI|nr:ATP-binding protein [Domibacillus aminovorans]OAH54753.1 hypothetical protein AWH48_09225 [Domibacillus aminovorans]
MVENAKKILHPQVALTKNIEMNRGAHILYTYSNYEKYIQNAVSFLSTGLNLKHGMVLIESRVVYETILVHLAAKGFSQTQLDTIIFTDNDEFYRTHRTFDMSTILLALGDLLKLYTDQDLPIRIWSKVRWKENICCVLEELSAYEIEADKVLEQIRAFTICVYNGQELPTSAYMEMMKSHSYVMTDTELIPSLYYRNLVHAVPPSLWMEEQLEEKIHHLNEEFQLVNSSYKNLIKEMPDAMFIISDFQIVDSNRAASQLFECEKDQFQGESIFNLFHPAYHELIRSRLNRVKNGEKLSVTEMKAKTYKNNLIDLETISFPFTYSASNTNMNMAIVHLRNIQERKELQKLAIKSGKLGIAGQLAASIAHEIRNPLTSIKGFIKLAKEGSLDSEHYSIIEEEIDRIETIASELLVLGKPLSLEIQTCNVGKMLSDVCILLQSQAVMKRIEIKCDVEENCLVRCNDGQMKQIFINFIKNAIEAMNDGGVIHTSVSAQNGLIVIVIQDEGKGIPDSIMEKIGEPFYSTKDSGTGLGLMVCFNIVEQYEGKIQVRSQIDKGTTFTISFPAVRE